MLKKLMANQIHIFFTFTVLLFLNAISETASQETRLPQEQGEATHFEAHY
jgi:hypothetical protein